MGQCSPACVRTGLGEDHGCLGRLVLLMGVHGPEPPISERYEPAPTV